MESRFRFDGWLSTSTLLAFRAKLFSHLFWNEFAWQFLVEFCSAPGGERHWRSDSTLGCTDLRHEVEGTSDGGGKSPSVCAWSSLMRFCRHPSNEQNSPTTDAAVRDGVGTGTFSKSR